MSMDPTRSEIIEELEEVSREIRQETDIHYIRRGHREADRLLDMYIDLGYLALDRRARMRPVPPQGYQESKD